jgi:endonuclease-3
VDSGTVEAYRTLLAELYPDAVVELDHQNAYQLLVATILAAQSTDKTINTLTPALFEKYPDAAALAVADLAELEQMIFKSGFFRMKAQYLVRMAQAVVEHHGGVIPQTMEALCALPGVARKTANVVLGNAFGIASGFVVDTHVARLAYRMGMTRQTDPVKIEADLIKIVPQDDWIRFGNRIIWHGRRVCDAKLPACDRCVLGPHCPSFGMMVVKPKKKKKDKKAPAKKKAPKKKKR